MEVEILGTIYTIEIKKRDDDVKLKELDGYCDTAVKKIVYVDMVDEYKNDEGAVENLKFVTDNIIRHEIIHAFLYESGLWVESEWAMNEEMVDWFAIQFHKILKAIKSTEPPEKR